MWDWINCHLLARHEYAIWCDSGRVYLRCLYCGHHSKGWQVQMTVRHHEDRRARGAAISGNAA
jgi:hypothetical protein